MGGKNRFFNKNTAIILYIIGLIGGFLFVRNTLNTKQVDVIVKEEEKPKQEPSEVTVLLNVKQNEVTSAKVYAMTDSETVYDLLQVARGHKDIFFETTEYFDRTDIVFYDAFDYSTKVTGTIFLEGEDITTKIREMTLTDGLELTLRLTELN